MVLRMALTNFSYETRSWVQMLGLCHWCGANSVATYLPVMWSLEATEALE